ncbi:RPC31 (YNL151C) [Zygosaccharomyces parabailii]|uniref:DNA-directed RNA polymerase III subunit n=1 Tax=Zygosaccharomyces bailii (strain CLIB 213 / ATCC 58445 / CBS 680 / BCRC 21525 / NBRC 1098 / NCYC 1416 / NRRL Y-2227) TaxID=1333698 RepID=A0A8J2TBT8_ZYGB2|nr:RPC31 (YNL151C) [Zygosaccharomyces parabailii]CDF91964.1 ZYBA0S16-01046g1_1 [Zygosaccharomyces bailii CLIB 213]CDH11155.1 related to DNA-directed RNA polymerase III subunit RPC7 [Zygosaccharomyces bailii ISA1307]SJM86591.1 related to DNA-directed RNA polymerase III subunit RPC7 [Zygosaccharomyces bailii]
MSFGRGRGGGGNSFTKNLPFGLGFEDVGINETTEFPSIPLPVNNPINTRERTLAVTYIKFGQAVRDGPFYTGSLSLALDDKDGRNGKKKKQSLVEEEGYVDGIERYSDRYLKKRKIGTSIDEHPYHLEVFPKELYNVMGIDKKKLLVISKFNNTDDIFTGGKQDENTGLSMLEKLKELAEVEEDNDDEGDKNKEAGVEEDIDEDFDDEDDDDDYNAEKYFNDGDDEEYGDEEDFGDEPAF